MTKQYEQEDRILKGLIQHGSIEKAPEGFTDKVMSAIETDISTENAQWWSFSNIWFWASIFMGIAGLVAIVFFVDFSFMGGLFSGFTVDDKLISMLTAEIGQEMLKLSANIEVSSITVIIAVSLGGLFILERLLHRKTDVEFRLI